VAAWRTLLLAAIRQFLVATASCPSSSASVRGRGRAKTGSCMAAGVMSPWVKVNGPPGTECIMANMATVARNRVKISDRNRRPSKAIMAPVLPARASNQAFGDRVPTGPGPGGASPGRARHQLSRRTLGVSTAGRSRLGGGTCRRRCRCRSPPGWCCREETRATGGRRSRGRSWPVPGPASTAS